MDHLVISNTVDSTGVVRVAGVSNATMSYFSGICVWHIKIPPRNLATIIFELSALIFGVGLKVNLLLQNIRNVSFYMRGKNVFSTV